MDNFKQINLPGYPEKVPGEHFIPTTAGGRRVTARQRAFAKIFAISRKRAESAIKAGFSKKNASKIANELLQKTHVLMLVKQEEEDILRQAGVDRVRVLTQIARLAHADGRNLYREDGSLKNPSEWDDETAAAIASVETLELFEGMGKQKELIGFTKKVKLWEKKGPLELLMKYLDLFQPDKIVFPDKDGNPMAPGGLVQNKIEVVFINPPGPDTLRQRNGEMGGDEIEE